MPKQPSPEDFKIIATIYRGLGSTQEIAQALSDPVLLARAKGAPTSEIIDPSTPEGRLNLAQWLASLPPKP